VTGRFSEALTEGLLSTLRAENLKPTHPPGEGGAIPMTVRGTTCIEEDGRCAGNGEDETRGRSEETEEEKCTRRYWTIVQSTESSSPEAWLQAADAGDALLKAAGGVTEAARALWKFREREGLCNLSGVHDKSLDAALGPLLLNYLRHIAEEGAPARSTAGRCRVEGRPHKSALGAGNQLYLQLWKDIHLGRVLLLSRVAARGTKVYSSPFGAVDKMNPDRSVSDEKRIVHDQRGVNSGVEQTVHPPALQPYHRQLARLVLHWQSRYPRLPVFLAKKDIRGAFRLLWIKPEDCELFGGEVPWRPLDMSPGVEAPSSCGAVAGSCEVEGTASSATGVAGEVTGANAAAVVERDRDETLDHPFGLEEATVTDAGTPAAVTRDRDDPIDHPSRAGGEESTDSAVKAMQQVSDRDAAVKVMDEADTTAGVRGGHSLRLRPPP
jgi:hypothetical protein